MTDANELEAMVGRSYRHGFVTDIDSRRIHLPRLVDAAKARPSVQAGWIFNDVIRVPNAACATQQAVVRVKQCCASDI